MQSITKQLFNLPPESSETAVTIRPQPGYSYKTTIESRRGKSSTYNIGTKVYINICHSDSLPAPKIASEDEIQQALMAVPGATYQTPLSLGKPRQQLLDEDEDTLILDACIHTQPFIRSEHDLDFRLYILELAMEHAEEALSVDLSRQFIILKVAAKGAPIPKRTLLLPPESSSAGSKVDALLFPSPQVATSPQVSMSSWYCRPSFKKDDGILIIILEMPTYTTPIPPWSVQIDYSCLMLKGVMDKVIDIMLPETIDVVSTANRVEYYKKSGHLVIHLMIATVRERYI
ncbi:pre-RNA processing PIH1/Nop17-domain-containing protein [Chlamydoabsidia padenii]|nr:pre-RNA processing PIH1/Nop17-domain-containing protein [Chlamydoabsidia padenii]